MNVCSVCIVHSVWFCGVIRSALDPNANHTLSFTFQQQVASLLKNTWAGHVFIGSY